MSGTAHTILNSTNAKICAFPLVLVSSVLWIKHQAYRNNQHGGIRHIIVLTVGQYLGEFFPAEHFYMSSVTVDTMFFPWYLHHVT